MREGAKKRREEDERAEVAHPACLNLTCPRFAFLLRPESALTHLIQPPDTPAFPCAPACAWLPDGNSELVLLDFHRFPGLGHGPPHEKAARVVLSVLDGVMIEPKFRNKPFGKLMSEQTGRVAVLWNAVEVRAHMYTRRLTRTRQPSIRASSFTFLFAYG